MSRRSFNNGLLSCSGCHCEPAQRVRNPGLMFVESKGAPKTVRPRSATLIELRRDMNQATIPRFARNDTGTFVGSSMA